MNDKPCTPTRIARLYISGPMTGIPDFNFPAFDQAQTELSALGYTVLNPARHGSDPARSWADYLRRDLADVLTVQGLALLDGWEASRGATLEVHVAKALGLPCLPLDEWLRPGLVSERVTR